MFHIRLPCPIWHVCFYQAACGSAHMKSILAIGELGSMTNVYKVRKPLPFILSFCLCLFSWTSYDTPFYSKKNCINAMAVLNCPMFNISGVFLIIDLMHLWLVLFELRYQLDQQVICFDLAIWSGLKHDSHLKVWLVQIRHHI